MRSVLYSFATVTVYLGALAMLLAGGAWGARAAGAVAAAFLLGAGAAITYVRAVHEDPPHGLP